MPFREYYNIAVWPMLVLAFHGLVTVFGVYDILPWFDTVLHFLGGVSIAMGSYYLLGHFEEEQHIKASRIAKVFLTLAITALAAVLWEFMEFGLEMLVGYVSQASVYDTIKDLAMGLLGAAIVSIRYWR